MENVAPVLFLLLRLLCMASSHARNFDARYDTAYACEGKVLRISCRVGEVIHLIRANYGRFSITICNDHGNTEWSVNCMSPKSLRVLHSKCSLQNNCSIPASTSMFSDPCPGTLKYLEAHFRCVPAQITSTTSRPSPPWVTNEPSVWTTSRVASASVSNVHSSGTSPPTNLSSQSEGEIAYKVTTGSSVVASLANVSVKDTAREQTDGTEGTEGTEVPPHHGMAGLPAPSWKTSDHPASPPAHPSLPPQTADEENGNSVSQWQPAAAGEGSSGGGQVAAHSRFCSPVTSRGLYFNWTRSNDVSVQPCPGGAHGVARWRCVERNNGVGWHGNSADLSECRSVWLTGLDTRIGEGESLVSIANDLAQVTSSNILYGGDMMTTAVIIKKMTDRMSKNIETFPDPSQREAIVQELLQFVVRTTSNLIDEAQSAGWDDLSHDEQMRVATSLLIGLEENAFLLADTVIREKTVVQTVKNILLSVRVMRTQSLQTELFPGADEGDFQSLDQMLVPKDAMSDNSEGGLVRIVFVAFQRLEDILVPDTDEGKCNATRIVNSRVISASLGKGRHIQLAQWVRITLAHLRTENVSNPVCVFWDYTMSGWSEEGCEIEWTNKTHTVCRCNHLTNFAVVMDIHANEPSQVRTKALQLVIYIGCVVCIVCLLLALITFHLVKGLKSERNTIHKNLCLCLLLAELLFVLGVAQTADPIWCGVVAGLLHFVFLCAFAWMFLEGFQLYVMLVEVLETEKSRMRWYYAFAYGAPLIIVSVSCVVDPLSYGTERYCWLRADNFFIFSFVGPVIAVILANLVFLSMAIYMMCRHSSAVVSVKGKEHSRLATARSWLRGCIILVFLLGLTWTFGLLYLNGGSVVMAYIFTALNSLQGLFIFLFHCLHNDKVRKEYRKCGPWMPWCGESYESSDAKDARSSACVDTCAPRADPTTPPAASSGTRVPHVANGHNKMYFRSGRDIDVDGVEGREGGRTTYAERASTLGALSDVRRQAYRHGADRVLVIELDRHNGSGGGGGVGGGGSGSGATARAATLHVAKRRRERHPSDTRRAEGEDPVYEEIRQTASDVSDEDMRRGVASRQSLRSYGDHSPLIPSPHNPPYPPSSSPYPTFAPSHARAQSPRSMQSLHSVHSIHSLHHAPPDPYMYTSRGHDR